MEYPLPDCICLVIIHSRKNLITCVMTMYIKRTVKPQITTMINEIQLLLLISQNSLYLLKQNRIAIQFLQTFHEIRKVRLLNGILPDCKMKHLQHTIFQ